MFFKVNIILFFNIFLKVDSANILGIYFHAGKSHHILGEMLLKELARRGHNVTMASPFPLLKPFPNYTDIHLTGILEDQIARENMFMKMNEGHTFIGTIDVVELTRSQTELTLNHTEMKKLIESNSEFDVIIVDWFMNSAILVYSEIFKAPIIAIASHGTTYLANYLVGNFAPPSYVPNVMLSFSSNMTFFERCINGMVSIAYSVIGNKNINYHDTLVQRYHKGAPSIEQLIKNVAIVLSNGHYSFETPRPFVPNIIPVGGFHVQKPGKLPSHLQQFMDSASNGVIYFSLGSNMKSTLLPKNKQIEILQAFSKIPYNVIWKWEDDQLTNKPDNVLICKWVPQNDILGHPNLKLFITHGGLLSTIESLYHGVPVLGIPIFGDQKANIPNAVHAGYALKLELSDLTEETLTLSINDLLNNFTYSANAKKRSLLLHDQPLTPMEIAVFWVEHVIRHKGAEHLQNGGIHLYWYQYLMIDVIFAVVLLLFLFLLSIYFLIKHAIKLCLNSTVKQKVT